MDCRGRNLYAVLKGGKSLRLSRGHSPPSQAVGKWQDAGRHLAILVRLLGGEQSSATVDNVTTEDVTTMLKKIGDTEYVEEGVHQKAWLCWMVKKILEQSCARAEWQELTTHRILPFLCGPMEVELTPEAVEKVSILLNETIRVAPLEYAMYQGMQYRQQEGIELGQYVRPEGPVQYRFPPLSAVCGERARVQGNFFEILTGAHDREFAQNMAQMIQLGDNMWMMGDLADLQQQYPDLYVRPAEVDVPEPPDSEEEAAAECELAEVMSMYDFMVDFGMRALCFTSPRQVTLRGNARHHWSRGEDNCGLLLAARDEVTLQTPFTYEQLQTAIFELKQHKFDTWYELFCDLKLLTADEEGMVLQVKFDMGS